MKKNFLLTALIVSLLSGTANAQKRSGDFDYSTAIGVKFYPGGISVKHFIKDNRALEAIGYFWSQGVRITGLYEIYGNIIGVNGLRWYAGPGAHIAFYGRSYYRGLTLVGVDGVIGLDYKFRDAPLNLSVDWQPSFEFGDGAGFGGGWGGLGIRYVF